MGEGIITYITILIFLIIIGGCIAVVIYICTRGSAARAKFAREAPYALSANATVLGKRMLIGYEGGTDYFVTFDIEGVGRVEFNVVGNVSGLLFEGDRVLLWYLTNPYRLVNFNITERSPQFQQIRQ